MWGFCGVRRRADASPHGGCGRRGSRAAELPGTGPGKAAGWMGKEAGQPSCLERDPGRRRAGWGKKPGSRAAGNETREAAGWVGKDAGQPSCREQDPGRRRAGWGKMPGSRAAWNRTREVGGLDGERCRAAELPGTGPGRGRAGWGKMPGSRAAGNRTVEGAGDGGCYQACVGFARRPMRGWNVCWRVVRCRIQMAPSSASGASSCCLEPLSSASVCSIPVCMSGLSLSAWL